MLLTVSCKKETISDPKNLAGTTWKFSESNDGVNLVETIKFTSSNILTSNAVYTGTSNITLSHPGNYTYNHPNIEIIINNVTYSGTINGASMCLLSTVGDVKVYIKQQ